MLERLMAKRWSVTVAVVLVTIGSISLRQYYLGAVAPPSNGPRADGVFLVEPYLQLGDPPAHEPTRQLALVWQTTDHEAEWAVEYKVSESKHWRLASKPSFDRVAMLGVTAHRIYHARLDLNDTEGLVPYRVKKGTKTVFTAQAHAPKSAGSPYRFVVFGDCGANSTDQKAIAFETFKRHPDFVMITGDIVYARGLISEYRTNFWPIYNADHADRETGAPLLRTTLFTAALGNHDVAGRDLEKTPDGLAYYLYWDQPKNGARGESQPPWRTPLKGAEANVEAFVDSTGGRYPATANFSFDYANSHWTVLDSNSYVDWTLQALRDWVIQDLTAAAKATWRFVVFHHPGFNSSKAHFDNQQMRLLADVFEAGKVDIVLAGHVHNYQRTYPLRFIPERDPGGAVVRKGEQVMGRWSLDQNYDGQTRTKANGPIYLITGAGGNHLYNPEQQNDQASWQSFTCKFHSQSSSFTQVDVDGSSLITRQLDSEGNELDRFGLSR